MTRNFTPWLFAGWVLSFGLMAEAPAARAEPYRLRADAFGEAQDPSGVLVVQGSGDANSWLDAEALVWAGQRELGPSADVLVVAIRARDPSGRYEARLGRQVLATGALRPVHLDGLTTRLRLPWDGMVEAFGGVAVAPELAFEAYDWVFGGRLSQSVFGYGTVGAAYLQRREQGRLLDHEVGLDLALAPFGAVDLGAHAAYDLASPGVSEARVAAGLNFGAFRFEALGSHRSPSRILPATSLFSVLGDVPAELLSLSMRWRAAPRLDLFLDGGVRRFEDETGEQIRGRALLRLDDFGRGQLGLEVRREGTPGHAWTGLRATVRVPIITMLTASAEGELVWRDAIDDVTQPIFPWGLVSLGFSPDEHWHIATALEGSVSPAYEYRVDGLLRIAYAWSAE